jgi:cytochrome c oxidase cbb3-type subunit 3
MRKLIPVYVRIPLILFIIAFAIECFVDSGDKPAIIEYPIVSILLGIVLFILVAIEIVLNAFDTITYSIMSEEQRVEHDKKTRAVTSITELPAYKRLMEALTKSNKPGDEETLLLDHDYDGIKELDNVLPPWWVYLFWGTVIWGVGYLAYYHVFDGENQYQEYERKNTEALAAIEEWKKTATDLVDASNVVLLTEDADLSAGKAIYMQSCVACHLADGGGSIGPNLTDDYWILGGGVKNIFHTISEGGREGKGMIPWKSELKPLQIQQVSSYIVTLVGTTPASGKEPEGELWVEEEISVAEPAAEEAE